jgi:hypothetical protein
MNSKTTAWFRICLLVGLLALTWSGTGALSAPVPPTPPPDLTPSPPRVHLLHADSTGLSIEWTAPPVELREFPSPACGGGARGEGVAGGGGGTLEIVTPGYPQTSQSGAPRLPFTTTLIALPPGAVPHLRISSVEEIDQPLPAPIAAAPRPEGVIQDRQGYPIGGAFVVEPSPILPGPDAPVVLEEIGTVRGVRLARLTFYPARPEGDRLRVVRRLLAEVRWFAATDAVPSPAGEGGQALPLAPSDPVLDSLRRQVLNPWDAILAPRPAGRDGLQTATNTQSIAPVTAFIEFEQSGLYRVTYADLAALGFATADPRNLRLFRGDDEVAFEWEGDSDVAFEPGEALLFYAEHRFSRWTATDAYRLVASATPGRRMTTRSADPSGLPTGVPWVDQVVEENRYYTPDCFCGSLPPGRDGDRWTWDFLRQPDRTSMSIPFQSQVVDSAQPGTLTLWLIGYTGVSVDPDHQTEVSLNGTSLGWVAWDGKQAITATLTIPAGVLRSGANSLGLRLPGIPGVSVEGAWLDAFAVRYGRSQQAAGSSVRFGVAMTPSGEPPPTLPRRTYLPLVVNNLRPDEAARAYTVSFEDPGSYRAYDVTDPFSPQRLTAIWVSGSTVTVGDPPSGTPRHYLVASDAGVQRPARVRALESIVDSGGTFTGADVLIITHPAFASALDPLVNLRQSQGLAVTVIDVLGVYDAYGDGRPDPAAIQAFIADAYASGDPSPTHVLLVGDGSFDPRQYLAGSTVTFIPPYLADVDPWAGETAADNRYVCVDGADYLPDLFIGRLPVQTLAQARTIVDKIVQYEAQPLPGGWNANVLLVADDADTGGDFISASQSHSAVHVTAPFITTAQYCTGTSPVLSDCSAQDTAALKAAVMSHWNQGTLLVQFTGHSFWKYWAVEQFLQIDDLVDLHNDWRQPVVVEMTCFTGAFHRPEPTLDESLVTRAGGGAVAAWGSTGFGVGTGHAYLADGFFHALFAEHVTTVGEATMAGKLALAASGQHLDLLDTFTLLGDPTTAPNLALVPWNHHLFLPIALQSGG